MVKKLLILLSVAVLAAPVFAQISSTNTNASSNATLEEKLEADVDNGPTRGTPPPEDECSGALFIGGVGTYRIPTASLTENASDPAFSCQAFGTAFTQTGWYAMTPATDGIVTLSLCDTTEDTLISVFTGSCGALTEIGCGEDECDAPNGLASEIVDLSVMAGETYYIQVADWGTGTAASDYVLNVSGTASFCEIASIELSGDGESVTVDGICAGGVDLYRLNADGSATLIEEGFPLNGPITFDVDFAPSVSYYITPTGDAGSILGASATTVPTLGEWALIGFISLLMGAALVMMRKRRATV